MISIDDPVVTPLPHKIKRGIPKDPDRSIVIERPIRDCSIREGVHGRPIRSDEQGSRCHGPQGDDLRSNKKDTVETDRYIITVKENEVRVYDKETKTWIRAWGDPHLTTSDGDKGQFHENLTIDLQDGTKLTFKTTPKNEKGISYLDSLAVMKGENAVVIKGLHDGKEGAEVGNVLRNADAVDAQFEDGTVLRAGREIDDLTFASNGKEIVGQDKNQRWGEHQLDGKGGVSVNHVGGRRHGPDRREEDHVEGRHGHDNKANGANGADGKDEINDTDKAGATSNSFYERLWALLGELDKDLSKRLDAATARLREHVNNKKPEAGDKKQDHKKIAGKTEGAGTGDEKPQNSEEFLIQQEISKLTRTHQKVMEAMSMVTNMLKSEHESKMTIIKNFSS